MSATIHVLGARREKGDVEVFLSRVRSVEERHRCSIAVARADRIFGIDHLLSAAEKALRGFEMRRNTASTISGEIMLYASAQRQIKDAINLIGITSQTSEIALAVIGETDPQTVLSELNLKRDDSVLESEGKDLSVFHISEEDLRTVDAGKEADLVLEKVALLDLDK